MRSRYVVLVALLLAIMQVEVRAFHIFGGDFNMTALSDQGHFLLVLNVYADASLVTIQSSNNDLVANVFVFRKRDHVKMGSFALSQERKTPIIYDNEACAGSQDLRTVEMRYSREIILDPSKYDDAGGYYVVWERCCRTDGVDNLQNRGRNVGMAFVFEFAPLRVNGRYFRNSSPDLGTPNGDYICINRPFRMNMKATDADGDELRYSLITPLQGHTSSSSPMGRGISYTYYPDISWAPGYGLSNVIPGNPSLAIHPKTGLLTVTANQLGIYVFSIMVEEYRKGVRLGAVRRDFQLKVIDCNGTPPPAPVVFAANNPTVPAGTVEICEGSSVDLSFTPLADVSYQWKKDGANIADQKGAALKESGAGDYRVTAGFTKKCAVDTSSHLIRVVYGAKPEAVLSSDDSLIYCTGQTAALSVTAPVSAKYVWEKDGNILKDAGRPTLVVAQPGLYSVTVTDSAFACAAHDTVVAAARAAPLKPIIKVSSNVLCIDRPATLHTEVQAGFSSQWLKEKLVISENQPQLVTDLDGVYTLRLYAGQCEVFSDSVQLTTASGKSITFDLIEAVCYHDTLRIPLRAFPEGGKFKGDGVENDFLHVQKAGVGAHDVYYELKTVEGCVINRPRSLEVMPSPVISLPKSVIQSKERSIVLEAEVDTPATYQWEPPLGLNSPTTLQPTVLASQTTLYTLTAQSLGNGCTAKASIKVVVLDLIYVPDVFSPNGDGINDKWEITNIRNFPDAEVTVYDRWGETVFYQTKGNVTPWDGTFNGSAVAVGEYTYVINPHAANRLGVQRGRVLVLR